MARIISCWEKNARHEPLSSDRTEPFPPTSYFACISALGPLQELGRIAKTLHILEYVDDPVLRRWVLIGLDKGEHLHSLARDIAFGRQGRFHGRGYGAQLNRASALSVVKEVLYE